MESQLIYKSAYFDSEKRNYGTNNNPMFVLDTAIKGSHKIKVISSNIPFSFYYFNGNLNINITDLIINQYQIPLVGNYTINELCTTLQNGLNTATSSTDYTVTYDDSNGRITIVSASLKTLQILEDSNNIYKKLGFTKNQTEIGSITGTNMVKVSPQFVVLQSNELVQAVAVDSRSYYKNVSNDNTIMTIPINVNRWQYNYYNAPQALEYLTANSSDISHLSFKLLDDYGQDIDLNGVPFTIKIGVLAPPMNQ